MDLFDWGLFHIQVYLKEDTHIGKSSPYDMNSKYALNCVGVGVCVFLIFFPFF